VNKASAAIAGVERLAEVPVNVRRATPNCSIAECAAGISVATWIAAVSVGNDSIHGRAKCKRVAIGTSLVTMLEMTWGRSTELDRSGPGAPGLRWLPASSAGWSSANG